MNLIGPCCGGPCKLNEKKKQILIDFQENMHKILFNPLLISEYEYKSSKKKTNQKEMKENFLMP